MSTIKIEILDNVNHSKGWGRFALVNPENNTPIITAATGNEWMGGKAGAGTKTCEWSGPMMLKLQVMLNVGKGYTARKEITTIEVPLIAAEALANETVEVTHKPGSQGITLRITGACRAAVFPLNA